VLQHYYYRDLAGHKSHRQYGTYPEQVQFQNFCSLAQFSGGFFEDEGGLPGMYGHAAMLRRGGPSRRFDEYYRCYPVAMLPGPDRENVNYGGKVILPPSALDKLTRLHISYPMMFELINGAKDAFSHAGVLEFIAEEGKIYVPYWLMQVLRVEAGDLLQVKSTDLPSGSYIKLQAQSTSFLDISDPKAVLENVLRNYSCLTKGDVFTFAYNEQTFDMAVLETKPTSEKNAIVVLETDLEVDFATPVGYEEPRRPSGTSTPASGRSGATNTTGSLPQGGTLHPHGTMAQAINYPSISPSSSVAAAGARATSSNFGSQGFKLSARKSSKAPTPQASTPVAGTSTNRAPEGALNPNTMKPLRERTNGPQPLRLPPGKLFFGYEIKPVRKKDEEPEDETVVKFKGQGQTLRQGKRKEAPSEGQSGK
jgi:ubiquitin fusion degradation protein 1